MPRVAGMSARPFFKRPAGLTLSAIVKLTGAEPVAGASLDRVITNIAPLDTAGPADLTFFDSPKFLDQLAETGAGVCLMRRGGVQPPAGVAVLFTNEPYRAFVKVASELFPGSMRPGSAFETDGIANGASVHATAKLESGVMVDPGAVIGPRAAIGSGTMIGATAVIGPDVQIGRDCSIGPGASIAHALIGDRVIVHGGCHIGQDGFGFQMGARHVKVPQLGRVIIQDNVEIGAGTTIDRGGIRDTVIGEGTKIDNLVQIAHNVQIGRHCVVVAQCGISGSVTLEDYVVLGGKVGIIEHARIGEGAQVAARSSVMRNVPAGERWGGVTNAKPIKDALREQVVIERLARGEGVRGSGQK